MGYALAQAALDAKHEVTLITAPTHWGAPHGVRVIEVTSAQDMFNAVQAHFDACDCLIMAAAVSDYTLATRSDTKLKKSDTPLTLDLVPTPDILLWAGDHKTQGSHTRVVVGFALEDQNVQVNAETKLRRKHLDMIIANTPEAIGSSNSRLFIKTPESAWLELPHADKAANARLIMRQVESLLG